MRWTHNAVRDVATMHHDTAAQRDTVCTDVEPADVLSFATVRHIVGTLFKHHRGRMALELRTSASVDHVVDMDADDDDIVAEDPPSRSS